MSSTPPRKKTLPRPMGIGGTPEKLHWKPGTMLMPVPAVMLSCARAEAPPNIITVAWAGTVCSDPPMLSVSIRPQRHSFGIIHETREFVVNIPSAAQVAVTDTCGVISGATVDKFAATGLTHAASKTIHAPGIVECPINLECRVNREIDLGSHVMFIAEITGVQVASALVNREGRLAIERAGLITFAHGHYYQLGAWLGHFGFSVRRKKGGRKAT